jgi:AcrR family transcriptional regulator
MPLLDVQRAAVDLFARRAFEATGIRELGSAVGLNSATLYHYAGGKQELLAGLMRICLDELLESGRAALASSTVALEQLAALIASHVGISALNPLTARVTDQEMRALTPERREALTRVRDEYEAQFTSVLAGGTTARTFRGPMPASPGSHCWRCAMALLIGTGPADGWVSRTSSVVSSKSARDWSALTVANRRPAPSSRHGCWTSSRG